jgi:glycosyltransferase involved in cell wall biosynthesis
MIIDVIIPAFNEEQSIALVVKGLDYSILRSIIVADNGSSDGTALIAQEAGAHVVKEPNKGYGAACLAGVSFSLQQHSPPDILVFIDGDYSDYPEQLPDLLQPILDGKADLVIGSRALGKRDRGAMLPQQIFGNWLATTLIRLFYGYRFTDLGPFRAITREAYLRLNMIDRNFGWTVEMQVKAAKNKLRVAEVPVNYRVRIGTSKVTGTLKGSILAGYKILLTIFRYL